MVKPPRYIIMKRGRQDSQGRPIKRARIMVQPIRTGASFWAGPNLGRPNAQEYKTIDLDSTTKVADTTGTVTLLNGVATGDDFTDRDGRRITMTSLYIQGMVTAVDNVTGASLARLIVVYDKQANGAAPAITDVLKAADSYAQINLNNRSRFQIIADKRYALGPMSDTATQAFAGSPSVMPVKIYRKLNLETQYSGTGATIASIATGSLYMLTIGNQGAGGGSNFALSARVRFVEGR